MKGFVRRCSLVPTPSARPPTPPSTGARCFWARTRQWMQSQLVIAFDPFTSVGGQVQNCIYVRAGLFFCFEIHVLAFFTSKIVQFEFSFIFFTDDRAGLFLNLKIGNDKVRWQSTFDFKKVGIDDCLSRKLFASQEHLEKESKKTAGKTVQGKEKQYDHAFDLLKLQLKAYKEWSLRYHGE